MFSAIKNNDALLIIDAIIFLLCLFGVYRMALKATTPCNFENKESYLVVSELYDGESRLAAGDTILTIGGYSFKNGSEVEVYIDGKNIGDAVDLSFIKNGEILSSEIKLVSYYSLPELIIISLVALLFIILPLIVILKSDEKSAIIFHWSSMGLAMTLTMTLANYNAEPKFISMLIHILFHFAFCLAPVFFIHFVSTFTGWAYKSFRYVLIVFYSIAILIAGLLSYTFLQAVQDLLIEDIQQYVTIYKHIFQVFLLICVFAIVLVLVLSYKRSDDLVAKRKVKWLILGFLGPSAFAVLWLVPFILFDYSLMSEILMHILLISFPLTVTIAIVKYQLMDIDLIFRRSVVYSIALGGFIIIYILLLTALTYLVKGINETIPAVMAAVLVAVLLQPAKNRIQKFVDRKFFRVEYNYREEQKSFLEEIKNSNDISALSEKIVKHTDALIPVDKIGFFILKKPGNNIRILAHKGFDILVGRSLKFEEENLKTDLPLPIAVDDKVEPGVEVESADLKVFRRWGMVLVFPIKSPSGVIHAFIVMGAKKSGAKYLQEDIDLINTVSAATALTIDRIMLQEELIIEHLEAERLEELNQMKSQFVSNVSHELKTPLTSIKMFAEILRDKKGYESEKSQEYLEIIEGESDRLKRLIDNVLDFAKIERGIKTYDKDIVEFNHLTHDVLKMMKYQFKMAKIDLVQNISEEESYINADRDAVEEAMLNILSNAIKYSEQNTSVTVSTAKRNSYVCFEVVDEGIGISETDLKEIFNPFFRTKNNDVIKVKGTGLGLSIVRHIINAHEGKIEVESKLGEGSSFTLLFPNLNKEDEKDTYC
jgi:signal transduction histidine kinase